MPSGEINGAIAGLDSIRFPTNSLDNAISHPGPVKPKKKRRSPGKPPQTTRSEYSFCAAAPVSARSDYSHSNVISDGKSVSSYEPHPPSKTSSSSFVRNPPTNAIPQHIKPFGAANKPNLNSELFELTDTSTAAMLHEIQVKEERGFPEHSYVNMHRRLAEEVLPNWNYD